MSGNEIKEEDLEKLKDLDTTLSDINNLIGKQLNLSTKIGGIRGEILTLLKLREKYGNRDIRWYGGLKKEYDMKIMDGNKEVEIQIKSSSSKKPFFKIPVREKGKDDDKALFEVEIVSKNGNIYQYPSEISVAKPNRIWILISINISDPDRSEFYIFNERELADVAIKTYENYLKGKNYSRANSKSSLDCRIGPYSEYDYEKNHFRNAHNNWGIIDEILF
jgi:hypothetical protein